MDDATEQALEYARESGFRLGFRAGYVKGYDDRATNQSYDSTPPADYYSDSSEDDAKPSS